MEWMREAFRRTRKDGATGVDGKTAAEYAQALEINLQDLLLQAKAGTYRAPPVRRVHIPKGDGLQTRPIGIPTFEDKVLQRAVVMILEAVYEQDFLPCSYGFRRGRGAHDALAALWSGAMAMNGGWVIEIDIRKFFDTLDHGHLREILRQRIRDGVLLRLIDKWLHAGVLEAGSVHHPAEGTPQGGVISPLLANVFLHEVLDTWFEGTVKPRLKGLAYMVRYADDAVLGFTCEEDARRVMAVLGKRFAKYGLALHPEKTRMLRFQRPPLRAALPPRGQRRVATFDFLGLTHLWTRSRRGRWVIRRRTAKDRFTRTMRAFRIWCRKNRHLPMKEQHATLSQKLRGHYGYFGVTGNFGSLDRLRFEVERTWRKWLGRRSGHAHISWERYNTLLRRYELPKPRIVRGVLTRSESAS
ncbi:group II intron reverse transcriptase/maturase [Sorangium sp. So ce887]|uniref:group II intron reverse transcriptase/maturase n=1 Tax=Sorangium sp. So ce887 TaxID=3133324 RepID=UPI003F5DFA13